MERLDEQRNLDETKSSASRALYQSAYAELGLPTSKIGQSVNESAESDARGNDSNTCQNGFPRLGGFHFTMEDLTDSLETLRTTPPSLSRRPELVEAAVVDLARLADSNCNGVLSKDDLERFKSTPNLPSSVKDFTQHVLDNFERFANFGNPGEIKDPIARSIAEEAFKKDNASEYVISKTDLKNMRLLNSMALPFVGLLLKDRSIRKLEHEPEDIQAQSLHDLSNFVAKQLEERKKLLDWR